jgi:hypothetical protein
MLFIKEVIADKSLSKVFVFSFLILILAYV